ncbi:MAG: tetratricopeptide repeat protein [Candidatus Margulisiibacteriota bacterium]
MESLQKTYMYYHNAQTVEGLQLSEVMLGKLLPLYKKDRNARLSDTRLKLNKVYQVLASVYTLQGMLYFQRTLSTLERSKENTFPEVMGKLHQKKHPTTQDFEQAIRQENTKIKRVANDLNQRGVALAVASLKNAIAIDPKNPVPHYQLGNIYRLYPGEQARKEAKKSYVTAEKLAQKEGDLASAKQAREKLRELKSQSK